MYSGNNSIFAEEMPEGDNGVKLNRYIPLLTYYENYATIKHGFTI
jgi:hypothetical protein